MTELSLQIRTEQPIDSESIERLHERAFGPGRFARTASRLTEMRSTEYLARARRAAVAAGSGDSTGLVDT